MIFSKEWLKQYGSMPNPSDSQIQLTDKILRRSNGIGVKIWNLFGSPLDTQMQQGHLLDFREVIKNLSKIRALG